MAFQVHATCSLDQEVNLKPCGRCRLDVLANNARASFSASPNSESRSDWRPPASSPQLRTFGKVPERSQLIYCLRKYGSYKTNKHAIKIRQGSAFDNGTRDRHKDTGDRARRRIERDQLAHDFVSRSKQILSPVSILPASSKSYFDLRAKTKQIITIISCTQGSSRTDHSEVRESRLVL